MKKIIARGLMASLCAFAAFGTTSCSDDNDNSDITVRLAETAIEYDADGIWALLATNTPVISHGINFSHSGSVEAWGTYYTGFTPSRRTNTASAENLLDLQFDVMTGGGMCGEGTPYLVAFWNSSEDAQTPAQTRSCRITYTGTADGTSRPFTPRKVYVNNSCYTYYAMAEGNAYCRKFAEGDALTLTAHGVHTDGSETTADFALADCKGAPEKWFVTKWTPFDLSSLGEVTEIYFTMKSTDVGQWGMNTPAYFCIDRLTIHAEQID